MRIHMVPVHVALWGLALLIPLTGAGCPNNQTPIDNSQNPVVNSQNPVANAGPDQLVNGGVTVRLVGAGVDPAGKSLTFLWTQTNDSPKVDLVNPTTDTASFISPVTAATLTFRLTVTNSDGATGTSDVTITVSAVPLAVINLSTGLGATLVDAMTISIAAPLDNDGQADADNVQVTSITLTDGTLIVPASLPVTPGTIPVEGSAVITAEFTGSFTPSANLTLVLDGTYDDGAGAHTFVVGATLTLPPASPGSATVGTLTVDSNQVTAPFPPQDPDFGDQDNGSRWTVPVGPFIPGTPTPTGTGAMPAPLGDPPAILFTVNNSLGITNGSSVGEPSGGSNGGGVVFVTSNWFAAFSTDGGTTFTKLDPTTVFPADSVGFCCDQIVQYVPSIDRFIWFLQGNGFRLAMASPADIISSGGTSWTYWNLTPDVFGQPSGTGFDYPDLSVGNNELYMSWDAGWPNCPTGCTSGREIARTSLAGIAAGGSIGLDYTNPSDSAVAWGSHLTQDTGNEIFWAGHNSTSQMRVFSLAEGSNTYFWRDINVSSWSNSGISSTTPDKQDWLNKLSGFPGTAVTGATRVGTSRSVNQLWFAWSAGTDTNFRQPHVEMVTLNRNDNFKVLQQVQIWNNSYAFAYPALATDSCSGEVGLSLEYGGGGNYENHVVGFWGDFLVYITTASDVGTTRFGDYVTIRQEPGTVANPGNLFSAFGYGLKKVPPPGSGTQTDIHYVVFGRPASSCE